MARPKKTIPTVYHNIGLSEDLSVKVKLYLISDLDGKIPMGGQQEFFTKLVRDFFTSIEAGQAAYLEQANRQAAAEYKNIVLGKA